MPINPHHKFLASLASCILALLLMSCEKPPSTSDSKAKRPAREHLVEVVTLKHEDIGTQHERTGSLRTRRLVRIFNQEEGRITHLPLFEGDGIEKGGRVADHHPALACGLAIEVG